MLLFQNRAAIFCQRQLACTIRSKVFKQRGEGKLYYKGKIESLSPIDFNVEQSPKVFRCPISASHACVTRASGAVLLSSIASRVHSAPMHVNMQGVERTRGAWSHHP